jgi:hypothetical protein
MYTVRHKSDPRINGKRLRGKKNALIFHFFTTVLNAFFFRMHATYGTHHTVRDFGTLIISGKEK